MKRVLPFFFAALCLCGCSERYKEYEPVRVADVYGAMRNLTGPDSIAARRALVEDSVEVGAFMKTVSELPCDTLLIEGWAASRAVAMFTPPVDSVFGGTAVLAGHLGNILGHAEAEGLHLPRRRYAAVVYDRPKSILFVDSVMLVALNHYLGADFAGYSHWPYFMRRSKTPEALPYDLAEALVATAYPYNGGDGTVMSRLLYEGALAEAKHRLVGGSEAAALGYDKDEWQWLLDNEEAIWQRLAVERLLYDTSQSTIDRLVAPSAYTSILGSEVPGRAGRFVGYRLVRKYLKEHPEASLSELLTLIKM